MIKGLKARLRAIASRLRIDELADRAAYSWGMGRNHVPRYSVLIAAPGGGNIGDQAMLEAFVNRVDGQIMIVTSSQDSVIVPTNDSTRIRVITLANLISSHSSVARLKAFKRFGKLAAKAKSVSIVGADTMDGGYSPSAAIRRWRIARLTAAQSIDTRILGFSWNGKAPANVVREARGAALSGAKLFLRDPISLERIKRQGVNSGILSSDLVFSSRDHDKQYVSDFLRQNKVVGPIALINMSGLIQSKHDQLPGYLELVEFLQAQGIAPILLPHVLRASSSDLVAAEKLHEKSLERGMTTYLVRDQLTPSQVRGFAARAEVAITGRMHLAIMSLGQGTPAVTLSTQGKVEGLMTMFEVPDLCLEPSVGLAGGLVAALSPQLPSFSPWKSRITKNLESVVGLSEKNFEGLNR